MPAVSKAQQKFMGMVHAAQKGDMENPSPEVEKAADSMSDKDAKDFASTSHKGLPDKIKEMVLAELRSVKAIQTDYAKVLDSMEKSLEAYKKSKGTPAEKQHIQQLKTLTAQKKKLAAELNDKVSDMYKDAELKVDEMNTTGGVEGYNTPFAFSGKDSEEKKGKRQADLTGYSVVKESELKGYLAADVVDDIIKLIGSKFVSGEIKNAPNRNYIYLKLTDIKFGSGVVKMLKSQFGINAKVDKTFGNQPSVSFPSNKVISEGKSINEFMMPRDVDSKMKELGINKIPISSQGEKVLQGMVKEKFLDKVTNAERLIYFVESLGNEKFGYRSKGKPLSSLVDRFWNDITSEAIFFGGKMAAYQVAMNIKDMKRNGEQLDSPYQMMKEYFKNFGMDHDRSRVFDSAIRNLEEWMKRNKIQESINEEKVYIDFLNKAKGFKQDRIKFNSYEAAVKWARKNFEKFNPDMIKYESVNEASQNTPAKTGKELADSVLRWYDFYTNYIDDGGQRRRAIKSNEDISEWFNSMIREEPYLG